MARVAAALSLLLAILAGASLLRWAEFHVYNVKIVKDAAGALQAVKEQPYFDKFEIDYPYGTEWKFENTTDETVVVQIVENHSGLCHVRFSPAGSVFCESRPITLVPGGTETLSAHAEDMGMFDYYPYRTYTGNLNLGREGEVLVPKDPDLEIERDFAFIEVLVMLLSLLAAFFFFRKSRRGKAA